MIVEDWHGLHREGWTAVKLDRRTFQHPARFAHDLIRRIYTDARDRHPSEKPKVLDPFAGPGMSALHAMMLLDRASWVGVEIERDMAWIGRSNIEKWGRFYGKHVPNWGTAMLFAGDSREIGRYTGGYNMLVTSPPYADVIGGGEGPGARYDFVNHNEGTAKRQTSRASYGTTAGQLANMRVGTAGDDDPDTFWGAVAGITKSLYDLAEPGAVAYWNTRDYVRNGEIVPFGNMWRKVTEQAGWKSVRLIRSWLIESQSIDLSLTGELVPRTKERKGQWRRVAEAKGAPRVDFETVLVQTKEI